MTTAIKAFAGVEFHEGDPQGVKSLDSRAENFCVLADGSVAVS